MRVLLDENLPQRLRFVLTDHDVTTVTYLKWNGLKNGDLLRAAEEAEFQVFLTADKSLRYQQNLLGRRLAIITLSTQAWMKLSLHAALISSLIDRVEQGSFHFFECH